MTRPMLMTLPIAQMRSMCSALTLRMIQLPPKRPNMKKARQQVSLTMLTVLSFIQPLCRNIVDEIAVDTYLCHLIGEECEKSEDEERMMAEELHEARLLFILLLLNGLLMAYLRQADT